MIFLGRVEIFSREVEFFREGLRFFLGGVEIFSGGVEIFSGGVGIISLVLSLFIGIERFSGRGDIFWVIKFFSDVWED